MYLYLESKDLWRGCIDYIPHCRGSPQKSKFLNHMTAGSLASPPCYQHLSPFHPFTTQVSLCQALPRPLVFLFTHVCSKMYCMHEKARDTKNVKLFLSFLCSVLWLTFKDANLLFLYNCVSCFLLVSSFISPPFLNNCVPLSAGL